MIPDLILRWTVRLAFACYVAALAVQIGGETSTSSRKTSRVFWTFGCFCFLVHVWAAFQFVHHWSHADAYQETARQTQLMTGSSSGAGLWLNYLFAALWAIDVAARWLRRNSIDRTRPRAWSVPVELFFAFMWFNATIVFGRGFARWMGVAGAAVLLSAFALHRARSATSAAPISRLRS